MNFRKLIVVLVLSFVSFSSFADDEAERAKLALMGEGIEYLIRQASAIERGVSVNSHPRMNYELLKKELNAIKSGINSYIQLNLDTAKEIDPVTGDYIVRDKTNG